MATMGLKMVGWAKMATEPDNGVPTYDAGKVIGKAVSTNLTITNAEGELYADDMLAEYVSEFASAEFTAETDNIDLEDQAELYGATYDSDELQFSSGDNPPYGGVGGYQVLMIDGQKKFRAWFFPKGRASIPDWAGATKGSSITLGTQPLKIKILSPKYGPWYYVKEFSDEASAKAYIETKLGIATWYKVEVQTQGSGAASPVGVTSYAAGENVDIVITGSATALYDNGTEKHSSISSGKYRVSSIAADHKIAIIF